MTTMGSRSTLHATTTTGVGQAPPANPLEAHDGMVGLPLESGSDSAAGASAPDGLRGVPPRAVRRSPTRASGVACARTTPGTTVWKCTAHSHRTRLGERVPEKRRWAHVHTQAAEVGMHFAAARITIWKNLVTCSGTTPDRTGTYIVPAGISVALFQRSTKILSLIHI